MPDGMMAPPMPPRPGLPAPTGPTAPAAVPGRNLGLQAQGQVIARLAIDALGKAVGLLGPMSEQGAALVSALKSLEKQFGHVSQDLTQQGVKMLGAQAPSISMNPMAAQQMALQRQQAMGLTPPPSPAPAPSP